MGEEEQKTNDWVRRMLDDSADRESKNFSDAIRHIDELLWPVLKCHLLCEYLLERAIVVGLPRGDRLLKGRVGFAQKLVVVQAMDILPDDIVTAVANLNRLRNNLAHQRDRSVSRADIDGLGAPLGAPYQRFKHEHANDLYKLTVATLAHIYTGLVMVVRDRELRKGFDLPAETAGQASPDQPPR